MYSLSSLSKGVFARGVASVLLVALLVSTVAPAGLAIAETSELPTTTIETGDAAAVTSTGTQANTNIVDTDVPAESEETTPEGSVVEEVSSDTSETEEAVPSEETPESGNTSEVSVTSETEEVPLGSEDIHEEMLLDSEGDATASSTLNIDNDVTADNGVETVAETGDNVATTIRGNVDITTGNAFSFANIINVLNTNIIDSYGFLLFLNALFGNGNIDLRGLNFPGTGPLVQDQTPCNLEGCEGAEVNNLGVDNTATINNSVIVRADTGGNLAEGTNASITTGDAVAAANIVNVANTNIIDSNYLLLAVNQFGNYSGDIVLPGFSFFNWLLSGMGGGMTTNTSVTNNADVTNNVSVVADTGDNTATSTRGTAEIETGDAVAGSSVSNVINTNIMGPGAPVYILLNITGNWTGQVFGLPPGLLWAETPSGLVIYSDVQNGGGLAGEGSTMVTNNAEVNNNVQVYALTGNNQVNAKRDASITTGDAYAATNIFNLINTNIIGRNLMFAVLNIMGDWSGNLTFGMPDLFVGGQFESQHNPLVPGSAFTYKLLVRNNGDLAASNVMVNHEFDTAKIVFDSDQLWNIGTLNPGEVREILLTGHIASTMNYGEFPSVIKTMAKLTEQDGNPEDNVEEIPMTILNSPGVYSMVTLSSQGKAEDPNIQVTKTSSVAETTAPGSVEYTIVVKNNGGEAYNGELFDTLADADGAVINEQAWDLGTIKAGESITVTYTMQFSEKTKPGLYTNEAEVYADVAPTPAGEAGTGGGGAPAQPFVKSNISSSEVMVVASDEEPLLPEACLTYISSYLRYGRNNDREQVLRLQTLLKETEGLDLEVTGIFDMPTLNAVYAFQEKYASDILEPWGIQKPTGYVYYTTQKKVNEIYCKSNFDLTPEQLAEISNFKSRVERSQAEQTPLPPTSDVGAVPAASEVAAKEPEQNIAEAVSALTAQAAAASGEGSSTSSITKWLRGSISNLSSRFNFGWGSMRDLFNFRY